MAAGPDDNGPNASWQLKALEEQELIRANRRRPQAYEYLRPSLIPNSTNI